MPTLRVVMQRMTLGIIGTQSVRGGVPTQAWERSNVPLGLKHFIQRNGELPNPFARGVVDGIGDG